MNFWISKAVAANVAEMDAPGVSTNPKKYVEANMDSYYVLVNTWASIVNDVCGPRQAQSLCSYIRTRGLLPAIKDAANLANDLICQEMQQTTIESDLGFLFVEDPRQSLQILRYPKRFSPLQADRVRDEGLASFLEVNSRCKGEPYRIAYSQGWSKTGNGWRLTTGPVLEYRVDYPHWLIKAVADKVKRMLREPDLSHDKVGEQGYFSTGTTALGSKTLLSKLWEFAGVQPYIGNHRFPLGNGGGDLTCDYVKVVAVPKSYKAPRIIAEVHAYNQFHMQGIRRIAEKQFAKCKWRNLIKFDDQGVNQELAFFGSVYDTYATIDLSSASDSISHSLAKQVLPAVWSEAIERYNPRYLKIGNRKLRRWIFQTSGNGTTFFFESIIFLAIALVATDIVRLYYSDVKDPSVYGDDMACDVRVYDTLVDLLEMLGFVVNRDKSFTYPSRYRESCGAEFFCGLDTSTYYYPRKPIDLTTPEGWQSLISLQHRLKGYLSADIFLCDLIRSNMKKLYSVEVTSSYPGTDTDDLWEDVPFFFRKKAPKGKCQTPKVVLPDWKTMIPCPTNVNPEFREGHLCLSSKTKISEKLPGLNRVATHGTTSYIGDDDILNMFLYEQFLIFGPYYASELDKLLGVSTPRTTFKDAAYKAESKWLSVNR